MKEIFVSLKTTDSIAETAFKALKRMGYDQLKNIKRFDYYSFDTDDETISNLKSCDILVNANKHTVINSLPKDKINILITDLDKPNNLLNTLRSRLGFTQINDMKKGVVWSLDIDDEDPKEIAEKIANELLHSKHYQSITFL